MTRMNEIVDRNDTFIAVTMVDVENRRLDANRVLHKRSANGDPFTLMEKKLLRSVLIDTTDVTKTAEIKIAHDEPNRANYERTNGTFVCSAAGDIDGSGRNRLIYGVTLDTGICYLLATWHENGQARSQIIAYFADRSVSFIRTISVGDIDNDGRDEIVIGTRPNGNVIIFDWRDGDYEQSVIEHAPFGQGTSNTREVMVADVDNDGQLEIVAAIARTDAKKWSSTPGAIFSYKMSDGEWRRRTIDDFEGATHTRMVALGDPYNCGKNELICVSVGIYNDATDTIDRPPALVLYRVDSDTVERQVLCEFDQWAIKSRAFAVGNVYQRNQPALICGTRNLDERGYTELKVFRFDGVKGWQSEVIDTSLELGFHYVLALDVDGDGVDEIIASDDTKGLIKQYNRVNGRWNCTTLLEYPNSIFTVSIHPVSLPSDESIFL